MTRQFLLLLLLTLVAIPQISQADIGPKPNFKIFFDKSIAPDDIPELLACEKASCEDQESFKEFGPQRFDCTSSHVKESHSCFVMAYGFPPYLKLRIRTKDGIYESEPFKPGGNVDARLNNGRLVLSQCLLSKLWCWWC